MSGLRIVAILLLVAGISALAYGGFSYTKETHEATLGPVQVQVKHRKTVNIPAWAGIAAIVIGGGLFLAGNAKR